MAPALPEPEVWSDETKAYFLLINAMSKEEFDQYRGDIECWGLTLADIKGLPSNYRDQLPSASQTSGEEVPESAVA